MSIVTITCFIIFTFLLLTFLRRNADLLSPGRLFLLVWMLVIGLADLKFSRLQVDWSIYSWAVLFICVISVSVGLYGGYVLNFNRRIFNIREIRKAAMTAEIDTPFLFKAIIVLFIAYSVSYFVSYLVIGYIPAFTAIPDLYRINWGIFGFGLFIQSFPVLIYLIVIYLLLAERNKLKKYTLSIILLFSFASYFFLLQRYYIVFALILLLSFLYYASDKLNMRNVLILLGLIGLSVYGISLIRLSKVAVNFLYYVSQMKFDIAYAVFTEPYMYLTMNLENFANAVERLDIFTYGYFTFDFIFALSGLKHWLSEYASIESFPHIVSVNYNTYTMFFIYYRDFGVLGLSVISLFMGLIMSIVYYRMKRSPDLNTISTYAIVVFVILFSFFVPIVSWLHFVFNTILIYLITRRIVLKKAVA
ncbi:MAG: oligosaccharide repeat unit polymerase [Melioribacteraceae bacterium]|nr:oligosaccharide repeat unit polymerase [Melioribacteraceae bacterium]